MLTQIFISAFVKAILQWIKSLVDSWIEKQKTLEEGRQQVIKAIEEKNKKADEELKKVGKAAANSTDDELAAELRDGYSRQRNPDLSRP